MKVKATYGIAVGLNPTGSLHVVYDGAKLQSGQRCYWEVEVWGLRGPGAQSARWFLVRDGLVDGQRLGRIMDWIRKTASTVR